MVKSLPLLFAVLLAGCAGGPGDADTLIAGEAQKLRRVEIGMSMAQVEVIMGDTPLVYNAGTVAQTTDSRPIRVDKFSGKDGKSVSIFYYRSSIKRRDDVTTDDETTAVVYVNGKVEALLPGEKSKEVIEVRFR